MKFKKKLKKIHYKVVIKIKFNKEVLLLKILILLKII